MRCTERYQGLGLCTNRLWLAAELMDNINNAQGKHQGWGVRQFLGQGQGVIHAGQGLLWCAEQPQDNGAMGEADHPG